MFTDAFRVLFELLLRGIMHHMDLCLWQITFQASFLFKINILVIFLRLVTNKFNII